MVKKYLIFNHFGHFGFFSAFFYYSVDLMCSSAWPIYGAAGCAPVGSISRSGGPHTSVQVW